MKLGQQGVYIQHALKDLKKELETIKKNIKTTTPVTQQQRPQQSGTSYSSVLQQRPPIKPSIIVKPRDPKTSIQEIKATLHKEIGVPEISNLSCKPTKAGNLVLTCRNDEEAKILRTRLNGNARLPDKLEIDRIRPRMSKIIIFGAPKADAEVIKEGEKEYYTDEILTPALKKH